MTIAEQLKLTKAELDVWARKNKGQAFIVGDFIHLVSAILSQKPGAPVAYVAFNGETPATADSDLPGNGIVDRKFLVVISQGKTLRIDQGAVLVEGESALFNLVEEAREVLRQIAFDQPIQTYFEFKGITPFQVEGLLLDAFQIELNLTTNLPSYEK